MSPSTKTEALTSTGLPEAGGGDRGEAGSQNAKQSREIGQDDPLEGSRMGREANKATGYPGEEELADGGSGATPTEAQIRAEDLEASDAQRREEAIRQAAYERYLHRGGATGDETSDWLEAERSVDQRRARPAE